MKYKIIAIKHGCLLTVKSRKTRKCVGWESASTTKGRCSDLVIWLILTTWRSVGLLLRCLSSRTNSWELKSDAIGWSRTLTHNSKRRSASWRPTCRETLSCWTWSESWVKKNFPWTKSSPTQTRQSSWMTTMKRSNKLLPKSKRSRNCSRFKRRKSKLSRRKLTCTNARVDTFTLRSQPTDVWPISIRITDSETVINFDILI